MFTVLQTKEFKGWLKRIRDVHMKARIIIRIDRMQEGNLGDIKAVGGGVSEARLAYGPGYRIYFVQQGNTVIVLLCGGDKSSQKRDMKEAKELAKTI